MILEMNDLIYKFSPLTRTWIGLLNNFDNAICSCLTSWYEARDICRSYGSELLVLPTLETADWMNSELSVYSGNGKLKYNKTAYSYDK